MPECHKCSHNGQRHAECLSCPGPDDASSGDVSLDAMPASIAEDIARSASDARAPQHVLAAFCLDLLQCSSTQLRVMSCRLQAPMDSLQQTADKAGVSKRSAHRVLSGMETRWPELGRLFSARRTK
jgi:hypothetical protein